MASVANGALAESGVEGPLVGDRWDAAFAAFHTRFAPFFGRREVRDRSNRYVRGLLGPVERKNGWQVAEAIGERTPLGVQRLLYEAAWDADAVRDELERFVGASLGSPQAVWVVDESGFLKKGTKSVGVQRQYSGTAGKVENCQIGVFLTYVAATGYAFLDRRLYLPEEWAQARERREEAKVPDAVGFQTKPALAWAMLERTWALGVPGSWVTGDTVYGQDPTFRANLEAQAPAVYYVLAVPVSTVVSTEVTATVRAALATAAGGDDAAPFAARAYTVYQGQSVVALIAGLAPTAWQRLTVAAGTKGPRTYDWVAIRALLHLERPDGHPDPAPQARWVLARRAVSDPTDVAYSLSNAPVGTPLLTLAQVAAARWPIEQCFEEAKGETGLDHYEVRHWDSWHRHVTLSLLAHTFLLHLRRQATPEVGGKGGGGRAQRLLVEPARPGPAGASGRPTAPASSGGPATPATSATPAAASPRRAAFAPRPVDPADRPRDAAAAGSHLATPSPLPRSALGLVRVAAPPPGDCPSLSLPPPSALPATRPSDLRL